MPAAKRVRTLPTDDWETLQLRLRWPEQLEYELIRPVVVFGLRPAERAEQTGAAARTIARRADVFDSAGFAGLLGVEAPSQRVPEGIRDALLLLKGEYPAFNPHELASIAAVRFGRRLSYQTVKRLLDTGPVPTAPPRRFLPYHQLASGTERRLAIVRLHLEGWSVQSIAGYLETSRPTVYTALQRWVAEDFAGLPDKSRARKRRALKVDLQTVETVRQLQENPLRGEFRMHSKLKQEFGIDLSPRTCGYIMAQNRALYGVPRPEQAPRPPRAMPFAARYPHQYWSVDLRYIDMQRIDSDKVYCISILENYSRAILASALSRRQDLSAYLTVLYAALRQYGSPKGLVSDSGSIFKAERAEAIYAALGITHETIERGKPWQNYIEATFGIQRRLADWDFAKATTWVELQRVHDRWVEDYDEQEHWAHRHKKEGRRTPAGVLSWVIGTPQDPDELARLFRPVRFSRRLDRAGYVRFRHWRVYGERGLPKQGALVWLSEETLTLGYGEEPLAYHTVVVDRKGQLTAVTGSRLVQPQHQSRQPWLWELSSEEWLLALRRPAPRRRQRRRAVTPAAQPLSLFDTAAFAAPREPVTPVGVRR
jgi:transposase InsO family protein